MSKSLSNRASERVHVEAFVIAKTPAGDELVFRTRDVSEQGLFLFTRVARVYPFAEGSTLELELFDYDQSLRCRAVVVRVVEPGSAESDRYPTGFGVKIVECAEDDRRKLTAMMARVEKAGQLY
jgi:hypothetical protein